MAVWGGIINTCEKKRRKKQRRKGKIYLLNAEFQRTARRDKKAFLSDQYKEYVLGRNLYLYISFQNKMIGHYH